MFWSRHAIMWVTVLSLPSKLAAFSLRSSPKNLTPQTVIQVCQNKDCGKRWKQQNSLPDTLQDLLPPSANVVVEHSGCLSQCDRGPNLKINNRVLLHDVQDPIRAAALLEDVVNLDIPSKLLAAVTVMEKATSPSSNLTTDDREKYLSSVIKALNSDAELQDSTANARAHLLRAMHYYEEFAYEAAFKDTTWVIEHLQERGNNDRLLARGWRLRADVCKDLGNIDDAIFALQQVVQVDPQFQSKVTREIQSLIAA